MLAWCQSGYWISTGLHKIGILVTLNLDGYRQPTVKIRLCVKTWKEVIWHVVYWFSKRVTNFLFFTSLIQLLDPTESETSGMANWLPNVHDWREHSCATCKTGVRKNHISIFFFLWSAMMQNSKRDRFKSRGYAKPAHPAVKLRWGFHEKFQISVYVGGFWGRLILVLGFTNLRSPVYPFSCLLCVKALVLIQTGLYFLAHLERFPKPRVINYFWSDCRYSLVLGKSLLPAVVVVFWKARSVGSKLFTSSISSVKWGVHAKKKYKNH